MNPVVLLDEAGRSFGRDHELVALANLSLEIEPGEFAAVEGPSGSGKSTLLNILGLLDRPTQGRYWLDGRPTDHLNGRDRAIRRAELLGFVFQSFHLLQSKNVIDNVALGAAYQRVPRKTRYRFAFDLLDELGLSHRLTAMPATLSGGELQRTAIARAVIGEKRVLLCDEPTGNLDAESTRRVVAILRRMTERGIAVVVATHDPLVSRNADSIIRLVDGRIDRGATS